MSTKLSGWGRRNVVVGLVGGVALLALETRSAQAQLCESSKADPKKGSGCQLGVHGGSAPLWLGVLALVPRLRRRRGEKTSRK